MKILQLRIKIALCIIFLCCTSNNIFAQINLQFNKSYIQCVDQWVAFEGKEDSTYTFGFIYIDPQAGLTLHYEGHFKYLPNGKLETKRLDNTGIKARLEPNDVVVALIPEKMYKDLEIETTPKWLKNYIPKEKDGEYYYRLGYLYNGWGDCTKGIENLEKAKQLSPNYEGLVVEMAFSYNCLGKYDRAIALLTSESQAKPKDAYINKELIYALINAKEIDKAKHQYYSTLDKIEGTQYNAENCFNIMGYYYQKADQKQFNIWYAELMKYEIKNKKMKYLAEQMKNSFK